MRTSRSRTTVLAAAGAAALALSLTACGQGGSDAKAAGPSEATVAAAPAGQAGKSAEATGAEAGQKAGGGAGAEGTTVSHARTTGTAGSTGTARTVKAPGATVAATPVCTTGDVRISAARHNGPPYTHIVLTAKNISGHSCRLNGYPEIQFLESHRENVPPVAKSKPAAPVVLKAGAPAYAMVRVSNGGVDEPSEPVSGFSVTLQGGGGMASVTAPGRGGIAVDPAAWKTGYWTYELRNGADDF
ncbi:hypothetical protein SALBM135S_04059 [Streptomyces alboniger]